MADKVAKSTELLVAMGFAVAKATDGTSAAVGIAEAVGPTVASGLIGLALRAKRKRTQAKADRWLSEVAALMDVGSPEEAAATVVEHIDEEWAHDAVIEAAKAILADINEACVPYLARLTARKMQYRAATDSRDRRAVALLAELDAKTLSLTRRVVAEALRVAPSDRPGIEMRIETGSLGLGPITRSTQPGVGAGQDLRFRSYEPEVKDLGLLETNSTVVGALLFDVLALLKTHGFAFDFPSGFRDVQAGPHVAGIRYSDLAYLGEVLQ